MADSLSPSPSLADVAEPVHIPVWAWLLVAVSILSMYLITQENGGLVGHLAENLHEFFHDARHFLGYPCH